MRRAVFIAVVVVAIALVFGGAISLFASPTTENVAPEPAAEPAEPEVYQLEGYESGVWPFLSRTPESIERSTINVIVRGDTERVIGLMQAEGDHDWEETDPEEGHADSGTFVPEDVDGTEVQWAEATGTARYTYVHDGEEGHWVRETAQLHDGTYYGYRTHIRMYESPHPDEPWVAMQAHTEHFDWFTLRHAVDGVEEAQSQVERDFMNKPFTERVSREFLGNGNRYDADGWATIVELAVVLFVVGTVPLTRLAHRYLTPTDRRRLRSARERVTAQHLLLGGTVGGILLGVRATGILFELYVAALSMHAIGALLYPFIAVGIPLAAYGIATDLERRIDAAVSATVGFGLGILIDYAYLGVAVLPIEIVLHRIGLLLAIGLIAGGAAKRATRETRLNDFVVAGLGLWIVLLSVMLFQLV